MRDDVVHRRHPFDGITIVLLEIVLLVIYFLQFPRFLLRLRVDGLALEAGYRIYDRRQ